jgi:hypothetical protein
MRDLMDMAEISPAKELENRYRKLFHDKIKRYAPVTREDTEVFHWMIAEFGKPTAMEMLDKYFKSTDKFVQDSGYSIRVIKTKATALLVSLSKPGATSPKTKKVVSVNLSCDKCMAAFVWVGEPEVLSRSSYWRLCEGCRGK